MRKSSNYFLNIFLERTTDPCIRTIRMKTQMNMTSSPFMLLPYSTSSLASGIRNPLRFTDHPGRRHHTLSSPMSQPKGDPNPKPGFEPETDRQNDPSVYHCYQHGDIQDIPPTLFSIAIRLELSGTGTVWKVQMYLLRKEHYFIKT